MKKVTITALLLAIALTAAGCGNQTTVGVCLRHGETGAAPQLERSLREDLESSGYRVRVQDAVGDQSRQNQQITQLLEDCDLLMVEPVMTVAADTILEQAQKANVPVIFLNHAPEAAVLARWESAYYIGSDLTQPGRLQSLLVRQLPDGGDRNGDGKVAYTVIAGPEDHMDALRWTQDCGSDPAGERLRADHGDWSRDSGRKLCRRQLADFGEDIEVIFCNSDSLALGALEALQNEEGNIYLVGIGGIAEALERIRAGDMAGTVCEDIPALSRSITETAMAILRGETPQKSQLLDFTLVTTEDLQ